MDKKVIEICEKLEDVVFSTSKLNDAIEALNENRKVTFGITSVEDKDGYEMSSNQDFVKVPKDFDFRSLLERNYEYFRIMATKYKDELESITQKPFSESFVSHLSVGGFYSEDDIVYIMDIANKAFIKK